MAEVILTDANFDTEVLKSPSPVLVDFWAPWCGPCRVQGPIVEDVAEEMPGIKVGKFNVDENPVVGQRYQIMSIPTLMIFSGGQVKEQLVGLTSKEKLKEKLSALA